MVNAIVILILLLIAIFAVRGTIKHMKGESPCCGGGGASEVKEEPSKLEGPVIGEKIMQISGMTCEIASLTDGAVLVRASAGSGKTRVLVERIKMLAGMTKRKVLAITFTNKACEEIRTRLAEVDENLLKKAVEDAGYTVDSIS